MQGDIKRSARNARGDGACEPDAPGQRRRFAITTASNEAPDSADCVPESKRSGAEVQHGENGELGDPREHDRPDNSSDDAAVESTRRLPSGNAQNLAWISH